MEWMSNFNKWRVCSWRERGLLVEATLWLGLMRLALWLIPVSRLLQLAGLTQDENFRPDPTLADTATDIGWAVQTAAAHTPWKSACLSQGLVGSIMLHRRNIPCTLYFGVAKDGSSLKNFLAHAWLSYGDNILTGAGNRARFTEINAFCSSPRSKTWL